MKLYTEEELRKHLYNHDERFFEGLTPIELPSDEEIENYIEKTFYGEKKYYFKAGVEFMKEQIIKPNK